MLLHGIATSTEMMNVTNLRTRVHEPTNSAFTTTSPQSQTQKSDIRRMVGPAALLQPTEKKGGLFSRRHSMGQNPVSRSDTTNQDDAQDPCSISNFHQIFHQIRVQNPTASMGAVQQMTMKRLSEIRQAKKQEHEKHGEENTRMTLTAKALNKFADVIRVGSDEGQGTKLPWNKSPMNNSWNSNSSGDGAFDGMLSFNSFRRISNASAGSQWRRRASRESSRQSPELSDNLFGGTERARTAKEMYAIAANEQGANMAPRKSIGDFTAMRSLADQSHRSGDSIHTDFSGLFLEESNEVNTKEEGKEEKPTAQQDTEYECVLSDSTTHVFETFNVCIGANVDLQSEDRDVLLETQLKPEKSRYCTDDLDQSHRSDTKSAISGLSGISDCTSACGDGLIVGFKPRHQVRVGEDEDHLSTGNFASDFSAWDRR